MSLKRKVAYDIVETLDRATVAAAGDGIGPFSPRWCCCSPACVPFDQCPNFDPATGFVNW